MMSVVPINTPKYVKIESDRVNIQGEAYKWKKPQNL